MTVVVDAMNPNSSTRLRGMTLLELERNLRLVERRGATSVNIIVADEGDRSRAGRRRFRGLVDSVIESATLPTWQVITQRIACSSIGRHVGCVCGRLSMSRAMTHLEEKRKSWGSACWRQIANIGDDVFQLTLRQPVDAKKGHEFTLGFVVGIRIKSR